MRLRRTSPRRVVWTFLRVWFLAVADIIVALTVTSKVRKLNRSHRGDGFPRTRADRGAGRRVHDITTYTHGADLYDDMLTAIAGAKERILFESFIFKGDAIGKRFKRALIRAAERGVEVRVVYDGFANLVVRPSFFRFPPPIQVLRYPLISGWMVLQPAPVGTRPSQDPRRRRHGRVRRRLQHRRRSTRQSWRDTHLKVEGGSVWDLDNAFVDFWNLNARGLPDAQGPRLAELGPARAGAPQRPAPAGVPDPEHVPGGDRPRRRPHLPDGGLLHPGPRHPAGPEGSACSWRRRADPRAGDQQPRRRRLALARLLRRAAAPRRADLPLPATRWCTPRRPRSTAAGRRSARRTSTGSASPATTRSTSRSSTTTWPSTSRRCSTNDLGQADGADPRRVGEPRHRRARLRDDPRPAPPVALTAIVVRVPS